MKKLRLLSIIIFFILMNAMGWIPEPYLKITLLQNIHYGEILLFTVSILIFAKLFIGNIYKTTRRISHYVNGDECGAGMGGVRSPSSLFKMPRPLGRVIHFKYHGINIYEIIVFILMLVTLRIILNVIEGYPIIDVLRNSRRMFYYLFFFLLLFSINSMQDVIWYNKIFNYFLIVGFLSYLATYFGEIDLGNKATHDINSGFLRVRHVMFQMAFIFGLLNFTFILFKVKGPFKHIKYLIFLISTFIILMSFYRTYYIGYSLALFIVFIMANWQLKSMVRSFIVITALITTLASTFYMMGVLDKFIERSVEAKVEVFETGGSFYGRLFIWQIRFQSVMESNPIFGFGFVAEKDDDLTVEQIMADPLRPDNDNGYASILVTMGIVGMLTFLMLYIIALYKTAKLLLTKKIDLYEKCYLYSMVGFVPYIIIFNFTSDNFTWLYNVLPNMILLAFIAYILSHNWSQIESKRYPVFHYVPKNRYV